MAPGLVEDEDQTLIQTWGPPLLAPQPPHGVLWKATKHHTDGGSTLGKGLWGRAGEEGQELGHKPQGGSQY